MTQNRPAVRDFLLRAIFIAVAGLAIGAARAEAVDKNPPSPITGATRAPQHAVELAENTAPKSEAAEAWDAVKDTTNPALLEAFITRYGATFFAEIAKARLDELKAAATRPSPPATAKPSAFDATKAIRTYPIHRGDANRQLPRHGAGANRKLPPKHAADANGRDSSTRRAL
jgi:hypothetical protein